MRICLPVCVYKNQVNSRNSTQILKFRVLLYSRLKIIYFCCFCFQFIYTVLHSEIYWNKQNKKKFTTKHQLTICCYRYTDLSSASSFSCYDIGILKKQVLIKLYPFFFCVRNSFFLVKFTDFNGID